MKYGQRISWSYLHHLNSKSSSSVTKHGEFQGLIKHTIKHKGKQLAAVTFDGNKCQSKVPYWELVVMPEVKE